MSTDLPPYDDGFPHIPEGDLSAVMTRLLEVSIATRAGVALVAPKSTGKSHALERVIDHWNSEEMRMRAEHPAHDVRRVVLVGRLKSHSERDCLVDIQTALLGTAPSLRVRGGRKTEAQLLREIVATCIEQGVVALLVEEGEFLTPAAMTALRDIMAEAPGMDRRQGGTHAGGTERGVGILAVGSQPFRHIVESSVERGHRWVMIEEFGALPAARVPSVFLEWFPTWSEHVARIGGEDHWRLYIEAVITRGKTIPVGRLIRHAQMYLVAIRGTGAKIARTNAPFVQPIFERLWGGLDDGMAA